MNLKPCPCCKKTLTTRNVHFNGRMDDILYFTCKDCHSTAVIVSAQIAKTLKARKPLAG